MAEIGGLDLLESLIDKARKAGAETADALYLTGRSLSVSQRLGKPEAIERAEGNDIGLRVLIGKQQAAVSGSDTRPDALDDLVARAVAMAKVAPEDPFAGIADPAQIAADSPEIEMFDPYEPTAEALTDLAASAEEAGLAVSGITNSEGGDAGWSTTEVAFAASNGFSDSISAPASLFLLLCWQAKAKGWSGIMNILPRSFCRSLRMLPRSAAGLAKGRSAALTLSARPPSAFR